MIVDIINIKIFRSNTNINFVYHLPKYRNAHCRSLRCFSLSYLFILKFPVSPVKFTTSTATNSFIFNFLDATLEECYNFFTRIYAYFISLVVFVGGKSKNDVTINLSIFSWTYLYYFSSVYLYTD